jgi:hypothetical protein
MPHLRYAPLLFSVGHGSAWMGEKPANRQGIRLPQQALHVCT